MAKKIEKKNASKEALKLMVKELKQAGLNVGEDAAREVVKAVFKALPGFVAATENKYDDMLIVLFPIIEKEILAKIDKIDGEKEEK